MDKLEIALSEYEEKFGGSFPVLCFRSAPDDVIIAEVERCIQAGEPFEPPNDGSDY